jgi:hypothetical protein
MSHGSPRHRKRNRRKEKRPQLPQPKPTIAAKASPTTGLIAELAKPTSAIAFAEALNEIQQKA